MVFLSWLLLKGEPGDQGGQGLKGERGSEVSETCWLWKVGTPENAVYYHSNSHLLSRMEMTVSLGVGSVKKYAKP